MSKKIKVLLIIGAIITALPAFSQVNASENASITNISIEPTAHDNSSDLSTSTKTTASDVTEKKDPLEFELLTEVRVAYYYFTDARTRDIYSGGGLYSIEASVQAWKQFYPWMSVGYLYASGSSIGEGDKTTLHVVPINLGVKYIFPLNHMNPYLGLGLVVAWAAYP